jgi:glyoxylase-like metal-dependent hydrolase (beta-lactamase superfamily II)
MPRSSGSPPISLEVYVSGYKPIPSVIPDWPESWQATWPATTSTLIAGTHEGLLVDALMTVEESRDLTAWLQARGKQVGQVYITHGHADHFFGLTSVLEAYPEARPLALPGIVPFLEAQTTPQWRAIWEGFFPGQLTDRPVVPAALAKNELSVEGLVIEVLPLGQSDVTDSSVLHIPELGAVIGGDVVYNGIHPWMYQSDHAARMAWLETLDRVEALAPTTIIAGHKDPDAPDDDAARTLEATRRYIRDFDAQVAGGASGAALVEAMSARYPDLGNPYTLWLAAYSVGHDA